MRDKQDERQLSDERIEESTLVAFLTEAIGGPAPPDLSAEILRRLHDPSAASTAVRATAAKPRTTPAKRSRNLAAAVSLIAAIAAVILVIVALNHSEQAPHHPATALQTDSPADTQPSPEAVATLDSGASPPSDSSVPAPAIAEPSDSDVASTPRSRPRPLSMGSAPFASDAGDDANGLEIALRKPERAAPDSSSTITTELQQRFDAAWKHLAVVPTEAVTDEQIAERISDWLNVPVSPQQATDPQALAELIRQDGAKQVVAARLLAQLLGPAWPRLQPEPKQTLTHFVATSLEEGQRFDSLTQQLFLGDLSEQARDASAAWLSALAGERSVPVTQQVGHALLDRDLSCARCHDDPIDSQIRQQDFWALAAVFENGLQYYRTHSGEPLVQPTLQSEPPKGQFFELPDGRQRVALPSMPPAWLDLQTDAKSGEVVLRDLESVTAQWNDNPRLARSLVNRVWAAVYGRPLTGAASDPDAPPSEEHFAELRDYLAAQTRAHSFDLAQLVAWVLSAPPMQRDVVLEPQSDRAAFPSDEQLAHAEFMHRTFAGYESAPTRVSFDGLVSMASRWNGGGTIDSLPALAQPSASGATFTPPKLPSEAERTENWLRSSFPEKRAATSQLPAQWLGSIEGFEQQARHLYYAAGYWKPSEQQIDAAHELHASAGDPAVALKQLWWALRNSR